MSLPIIRQKDATQIRMVVKNNSKQIECFALVPISRAPDTGDARHPRIIFVKQHFQTHAMMFQRGKQMIVDFKARLFLGSAIKAAEVRKNIELKVERSFK